MDLGKRCVWSILLLLVACTPALENVEPPDSYEVMYTYYDSGYAGTVNPIFLQESLVFPGPSNLTMERIAEMLAGREFEQGKRVDGADCFTYSNPKEIMAYCLKGRSIVYYTRTPFEGTHRTVRETWRLATFPDVPTGECRERDILCPFRDD